MGIFKNLLKAAGATQAPNVRKITFDPNWQDEMESLRLAIQGKDAPTSVSVEFPDALCDEICTAIETHQPSARIPYSDVKVPINNVGESYRQAEIAKFCENKIITRLLSLVFTVF
jgi:hypothetical protein